MKNLMITLLLGFVVIFGASCSKKMVVTKQPVSTVKTGPILQAVTQYYVRDLSAKDSAMFFNDVWFYNPVAISLELVIVDKTKPFSVENGVANKDNTDIDLTKKVPTMTPGKIIKAVFYENSNVIAGFIVSWDANDKTYHFKLQRTRSSPIFELNAKAVVIYKGIPYNVLATIPPGKKCILLFYGNKKEGTVIVTENAKGQTGNSNFNSSNDTLNVPDKRERVLDNNKQGTDEIIW